jgi:tRNA(Arg) A34 adenosine deaminase TadA
MASNFRQRNSIQVHIAIGQIGIILIFMFKNPIATSVKLALPDWISSMDSVLQQQFPTNEDKMHLAIDLANINVEMGTGGPFGAAIFDSNTNRVISVGVNRVVPLNNSTAHAEMMAFMLAQKRLQRFRLDSGDHHFVLATSAQPCAMCYGACPWAGINRLLIGAQREDVESLTEFDEGPMPYNWIAGLQRRGIEVIQDVLRDEARKVFVAYQRAKGISY